jgi:hypothetical protein
MSKKPLDEKTFFIIKKESYSWGTSYHIHDRKMYTLTTAVKKLLALDTLNEDREQVSYHLQEVSFSAVEKPLVLTNEVKKTDQEELPF